MHPGPLVERFPYGPHPRRAGPPVDELDVSPRALTSTGTPTDPAAHDDYFNNFLPTWRISWATKSLRMLVHLGSRLKPALAWSKPTLTKLRHKGTPYYRAMTRIPSPVRWTVAQSSNCALDEDSEDNPSDTLFCRRLNHEKPDRDDQRAPPGATR